MSNRIETARKRLETYKKRLTLYLQAEEAILSGAQSYAIGSRNLTRADLAEVRKMINSLEDGIDELEAIVAGNNRRKAMRFIPRDV